MFMIDFISSWAEQIIVAVIIATIIEMILPNGNNKKYIKVVIGVYILFTVLSPILGKITNIDFGNIDYDKYLWEFETSCVMSDSLVQNNDKTTIEMYINNLKQDMKSKLKEQGYIVNNVDVEIEMKNEKNYGKIKSISLRLYKSEKENEEEDKEEERIKFSISVNKIEEVKIINNTTNTKNSKKEEIKNSEKNEIKRYLSSVYEVNKKNIKINE